MPNPSQGNRLFVTGVSALAVPLVVGLGLWISTGRVGCGQVTIPVEVVVIDSQTKHPVSGASVQLRFGDYPIGADRRPVDRLNASLEVFESHTDGNGRAELEGRFGFTQYRNLFRRTTDVSFGLWLVRVSAEGYTLLLAPLTDYAQRRQVTNFAAPLSMRVELQARATNMNGQRAEWTARPASRVALPLPPWGDRTIVPCTIGRSANPLAEEGLRGDNASRRQTLVGKRR